MVAGFLLSKGVTASSVVWLGTKLPKNDAKIFLCCHLSWEEIKRRH
jgi:hypothetical protein